MPHPFPSSLISLLLLFHAPAPAHTQTKVPRIGTSCPDPALPCQNNGKCYVGDSDFGYHGTLSVPFLNSTNIDFMYCECIGGYTGVMCEHKVDTCGDDEHACFNGATCVRKEGDGGGVTTYGCDCENAGKDSSFAGHYCEHAATSFCEYGVAVSKHAFCVNGGTCKESIVGDEDHPGCLCPDGFTGDHCEYTLETAAKIATTETKGSSTTLPSSPQAVTQNSNTVTGLALLIAVIVAAVIVVAFFIVKYVRRNRMAAQSRQKPIEDARTQELDADGGTMPQVTPTSVQITTESDADGEFI